MGLSVVIQIDVTDNLKGENLRYVKCNISIRTCFWFKINSVFIYSFRVRPSNK
jgi:hypothetical protein